MNEGEMNCHHMILHALKESGPEGKELLKENSNISFGCYLVMLSINLLALLV